jgi:1,4-dihydroxy-2-naphthoate octaprenyltransferase
MKKTLYAFFLASRPKTLIAGFCPVVLGACFSFYLLGKFDSFYFSLILSASILIQIATNFFNDAVDSENGRDTEKRLGPDRASAMGSLSPMMLKASALFFLAIAFIIGLLLFAHSDYWVLLVGLPALLLAYLYTGTDYSLSANGVADLFVVLYFGLVPVWATNYILSGVHSDDALWAGLQCGLLCNVLLVINNLRDEEEDAASGKKTVVVKFGRSVGLIFLGVSLFLPYVMNLLMFSSIFFRAGLWSFIAFPLASYIFIKVFNERPSTKYNSYLGLSALHLMVYTLFYSMGILSS